MRVKRAICLNRFYGEVQIPTARMLQDVVEELTPYLAVTIVTSKGTYVNREQVRPRIEPDNVQVIQVWNCGIRLIDWLWFWCVGCCILLFRRWDVCLTLTDPPFLNVLSVVCRFPIVFWIMDLYPDALLAHQLMAANSLVYRALVSVTSLSMRRMAKVICLDGAQLARCKAYLSDREIGSKCIVIGPWDNRGIGAWTGSTNRFREKFGLGDRRVLLYAGNLGAAHHWECAMDAAFACLMHGIDEWRFVFVVRGQRVASLKAYVEKHHLTNVVVCDYQPEELTEEMFGAASVHLITLREGWEGVVVPSKLYGLLGSGKPVVFVGPSTSGSSEEIVRGRFGVSLPTSATGDALLSSMELVSTEAWSGGSASFRDRPKKVAAIVLAAADTR